MHASYLNLVLWGPEIQAMFYRKGNFIIERE